MELQSLYLKESQIEKIEAAKKLGTKTFWKRQFQIEPTKSQQAFDGVFGILLPAVCFLADPIVFRGENSLLGAAKPFAYLLSYVSIMALLAFMLWGEKLKWFNGILSGFFALSALISMLIGIGLLPFSLLGLMILIGALGFTPLFTGFVFWRSAVRAFKAAKPILETKTLVYVMILSSVFSFLIPEIINVKINRGLQTIADGDATTIERTTRRLKLVSPLVNAEPISRAYYREESNSGRREALGKSYRELTGKDVTESRSIWLD